MLVFYKPNKSNKGALANFKTISKMSRDGEPFKEGCVYLSIVKQTGWNEKNKTGTFKDGESVNVKLNAGEVSKIISVLERGGEFSGYHGISDHVTTIKFSPWTDKATQEPRGYALFVTTNKDGEKNSFSMGFQFGDDVQLREFLKFSLEHIFMASHAEDKRKFKESQGDNKRSQLAEVNDDVDDNNVEEDDDTPLFG